jgi:hypothetical protein
MTEANKRKQPGAFQYRHAEGVAFSQNERNRTFRPPVAWAVKARLDRKI